MKKIIIFLMAVVFYSCNSQSQLMNKEIKKHNMEYFNIEKYKDWEIDTDFFLDERSKFLKKGNDRIEIEFSKEDVYIIISSTINQYALYKSYFINNSLEVIGSKFYNFHTGVWKHYDERGKLIKEVDNDIDYKFSVDQLIKKMQKEYDLDINKRTKTIVVDRWTPVELNEKPLYCVMFGLKEYSREWKYVLVDGTTGETLFTTLFYFGDNEKLSPFYQYLENLEKQQAEDNEYFTTYKGKDYTKKEWKEFQEQWHKKHEENKGKSFWDDIFPKSKKK